MERRVGGFGDERAWYDGMIAWIRTYVGAARIIHIH